MRIIMLLAAAGAMIAGTASARPGTATISRGGSPGGSHSIGGGGAFTGHGPFRPGMGRDHRRHHGRFGPGPGFIPAYGAGGIAGPFEAVDPYGSGFFAGAGGRVRVEGGRPRYDYDRSYPYQWASGASSSSTWTVEESEGSPPRCAVENGVRVCRGW